MRIKQAQKWVQDDWQKKSKSVDEKTEILFMIEELGEFAEMVRKQEGKKDRKKLKIDLEKELGDLLICLATLANRHGIDLEKAFLKSKRKIEKRHRAGH